MTMCVYDFDYYVEYLNDRPQPERVRMCECGHLSVKGESIREWVEIEDENNSNPCEGCDEGGTIPRVNAAGEQVGTTECPLCDGAGWRPYEQLATGWLCSRCIQAARLLDEMCSGQYSCSGIRRQYDEHVDELVAIGADRRMLDALSPWRALSPIAGMDLVLREWHRLGGVAAV